MFPTCGPAVCKASTECADSLPPFLCCAWRGGWEQRESLLSARALVVAGECHRSPAGDGGDGKGEGGGLDGAENVRGNPRLDWEDRLEHMPRSPAFANASSMWSDMSSFPVAIDNLEGIAIA